jgi:2-polyprenyl-3-methyl-5-hydroxy-6-metoxy-1,4-benzoquinol methylase
MTGGRPVDSGCLPTRPWANNPCMATTICRLCSSEDLRLLYEVRGSTLDRCSRCGFVQVREQPTAEELRAIYAGGYLGKGKYEDLTAQRRENERRLALLEHAGVPSGGKVLEVGCATGEFIALAGARFDMWGLDLSPVATDLARQTNPRFAAQIFTGFIEDQHFQPAQFDAIVLWDVIEHLWDPRKVCHELVKYLRPGGSLLLSTPDIGAVTARVMRNRWAFMTPPEHLGFFSTPSLEFLLERDLGLRTTSSESRGKWANVGFLAYKLRRVFPVLPEAFVQGVRHSPLGAATLYVPTADVRYVAAKKHETRA